MFAWYKYCFSHYFTLTGRASRAEFWSFFFVNLFIQILIPLVGMVIGIFLSTSHSRAEEIANYAPDFTVYVLFLAAGFIYFCLSFLPMVAVTVRRMHDRDLSGWWVAGAVILMPIGSSLLIRDLTTLMFTFGNVGGFSSIVIGIDSLLCLFIFICMLLGSIPGPNQYGIRAPLTTSDVVPSLYGPQPNQLDAQNLQFYNNASQYNQIIPQQYNQPVYPQSTNGVPPDYQQGRASTTSNQSSNPGPQPRNQSLLDEMRSMQRKKITSQGESDNKNKAGKSVSESTLISSLKNKAKQSSDG